MTPTERKRAWRLQHPEQSREHERRRAQARRDGQWDRGAYLAGGVLRPCKSSDSYHRYENTIGRITQRMFWRTYGPGTAKMTVEEFRAAGERIVAAERERLWSEYAQR